MPDELRIDKEFAQLCGQQTPEELNLLEQSLSEHGCLDPIILWANHDDTILDGMTRYRLCTQLGITWKTKSLKLDTREDARNWIIDNQLARRNLSEERKAYLRGKRYQAEKKSEHDGGKGKERSGGQNVHHSKTAERLADQFNVDEKTIRRDAKFAEAVDNLAANVGKPIKDEILSGRSGLRKKEVVAIAAMPAKQQVAAVQKARDGEAASGKPPFDLERALGRLGDAVRRLRAEAPRSVWPLIAGELVNLSKEFES